MPHAAELAAAYVLTKAATTAGLVLWVRRRRNGKDQTKRRAVAVELVAGPRTPRRNRKTARKAPSTEGRLAKDRKGSQKK